MIRIINYQVAAQILRVDIEFDYQTVIYQRTVSRNIADVQNATAQQVVNFIKAYVASERLAIDAVKVSILNVLATIGSGDIEV